MRKYIAFFLTSLFCLSTYAGNHADYQPLDKANPVSFHGDHITYKGVTIALNEKSFFIDGQLTDAEAAQYPYVFNSINKALDQVKDGTATEPMTLYIAPYVYWVDDPDDAAIRKPITGAIPYGRIVKCNGLKFYGLTDDARHVVLASRRGQTQGAEGNFTMFYFDGNDISSENLTFGNYCNVDLEFPLLPKLNREKRSNTVTQAQLIICNSDRVMARNTRFISRLNLCPFAAAKRILFDRCYFESTDDALCGTGVYLDCRFTFFSSKPFYSTQGTGAIFLNCDFDVLTLKRQYLTKVGSPVAIVDSRFHSSSTPLYLGWTQDPTDDLRCYQYNVTLNGQPVRINEDKPACTVDMTGKPVLEAYRVEYKGKVMYNTYNLLRGNDGWDPMGIKEQIFGIEKETGRFLTNIPTYARIVPHAMSIESGGTTAKLQAVSKRFGNIDKTNPAFKWSIAPADGSLVQLAGEASGKCEVTGINKQDETKKVVVNVVDTYGVESASVITVAPAYLEAPAFTSLPTIRRVAKGKLDVNYALALEGRKDESLITWYRCKDAMGKGAVAVVVSRLCRPETTYELSSADVGYYLMASVAPKHLRCHPGKLEVAITPAPITAKEVVKQQIYYTDFQNFPNNRQPEVIPGFWTIDGYKPLDLSEYDWEVPTGETWYYGTGLDGMKGTGLIQNTKGARLLYTPVQAKTGDMTVTLNVDPGKTAGQGFGSATGQYLELYIKYDTRTLTGYGLRIVRTTKYDNAVDFILMKYENGVATEISEPVAGICYRTDCTITLKAQGKTLAAHVDTGTELPDPVNPELKKVVDIRADIKPNAFGGTGVQHTGSTGANATMLHWLKMEWK